MLLAGRDFESLSSLKNEVVMAHFESEFSFEHVEELACMDVGVTSFVGAGWHQFFDDA
jgi:hypothetical protein